MAFKVKRFVAFCGKSLNLCLIAALWLKLQTMNNFDVDIKVEVIGNVAKIVACSVVPKKKNKAKPPRVVMLIRSVKELELLKNKC